MFIFSGVISEAATVCGVVFDLRSKTTPHLLSTTANTRETFEGVEKHLFVKKKGGHVAAKLRRHISGIFCLEKYFVNTLTFFICLFNAFRYNITMVIDEACLVSIQRLQ
jgi:hypothetical protein